MEVRIDLSKKAGTIGHCMKENRDRLLAVKSSAEAHEMLKGLFEAENINTPRSRTILAKLEAGMPYVQTLMYLNNIIMKSQKLGVI